MSNLQRYAPPYADTLQGGHKPRTEAPKLLVEAPEPPVEAAKPEFKNPFPTRISGRLSFCRYLPRQQRRQCRGGGPDPGGESARLPGKRRGEVQPPTGGFAPAYDDDRPYFARGEDEACPASDRDGGFRFWSRDCENEHGDVWFMGLRPRFGGRGSWPRMAQAYPACISHERALQVSVSMVHPIGAALVRAGPTELVDVQRHEAVGDGSEHLRPATGCQTFPIKAPEGPRSLICCSCSSKASHTPTASPRGTPKPAPLDQAASPRFQHSSGRISPALTAQGLVLDCSVYSFRQVFAGGRECSKVCRCPRGAFCRGTCVI